MTPEVAIAAIVGALVGLIGSVAGYFRAKTKLLQRQMAAQAQTDAEVRNLRDQTERRMRRLTEATGFEGCITPPFGVPTQLPIDESEKHRR